MSKGRANLFFRKKYLRDKVNKEFGIKRDNIELEENVSLYYEDCINNSESNYIDDDTWDDLEMDEVFLKINHTYSFIGEQYLYKKLHFPLEKNIDIEEHIKAYSENEELRLDVSEKLAGIGKSYYDYMLIDVLRDMNYWQMKNGWQYRVLQLTLFGFLIAAMITGNPLFLFLSIINAVSNLVIYVFVKGNYEQLMFSTGSVKAIVAFSQFIDNDKRLKIMYHSDELDGTIADLKIISRKMIAIQTRQSYMATGDLSGILIMYIYGVLLFDVIALEKVVRLLSRELDKVIKLYELVGRIDTEISIASYRKSVVGYTVPEYTQKRHVIMEQMRHPLLDKAVENDVDMTGNILVTGTNASGKSTYMKGVAINIILAQTINTALCSRISLPRIMVITSMSLRDDIVSGQSYYMKEILQVKRIIDADNDNVPIFTVVDEIFKGTNSKERVAAAYAVLSYMNKLNLMVMIATHDMELIDMLKEMYECYCFNSKIKNGKIYFDYKLYKGVNKLSNAIALMELMNYPKEIVDKAREMV